MIGDVKLSSRVFLAPMAAVNCTAFRLLCKEYGAGLVYTQMIDADGLLSDKSRLLDNYVGFSNDEHPVAAQLVGAKPDNMVKAVKILEKIIARLERMNGTDSKAKRNKKRKASKT